jgi:hypothetical protein
MCRRKHGRIQGGEKALFFPMNNLVNFFRYYGDGNAANQFVGTDPNGTGKAGFVLDGLCDYGPSLDRIFIEVIHAGHVCVEFSKSDRFYCGGKRGNGCIKVIIEPGIE